MSRRVLAQEQNLNRTAVGVIRMTKWLRCAKGKHYSLFRSLSFFLLYTVLCSLSLGRGSEIPMYIIFEFVTDNTPSVYVWSLCVLFSPRIVANTHVQRSVLGHFLASTPYSQTP